MVLLLEEALQSGMLRRKLVTSLNTDERWNIIVDKLTSYRIAVFLDRSRLKDATARGSSPADWLLAELESRMCSFEVFTNMLREFDLIEELSLLVPPEPMEIVAQPGEGEGEGERVVRVERSEQLQLTCMATGVPRPAHQWYHNNAAIAAATGPTLSIDNFSEGHRGLYWCELRQTILGHESRRTTAEVTVDLLPLRPELLIDLPHCRTVARGQTLCLSVRAEGYPSPQYEWFRSSVHLPNGNVDEYVMPNQVIDGDTNSVEIRCAGPEDEGVYCCRVSNIAGETFSSCCSLSIFERPPEYIASAKVALLIGNSQYAAAELCGLAAPTNDVVVLAAILRDLGFHVIALRDLTRNEMLNAFRWFARVLPENAYAFFYFAGHGFSKLASKFMMPADCPGQMSSICLEHCLCEEQLIQMLAGAGEGRERPLQLLVMLFDCCLVESRNLSIGRTAFDYDLGECNVVLGTATRNHQPAYEQTRRDLTNGLFVDRLRSHLARPLPIIDVLKANQTDFKERQQQPTTYFSGADNCSLTDPVQDDPVLEKALRSELEFPTCEREVFFKKTMESFQVTVKQHRDCFLNSIDVILPDHFTHSFSVEVNSTELTLSIEGKVVTISNIQKLKCALCVTVVINGVMQNGSEPGFVTGPYDSCQFTVEHTITSRGQLWHPL